MNGGRDVSAALIHGVMLAVLADAGGSMAARDFYAETLRRLGMERDLTPENLLAEFGFKAGDIIRLNPNRPPRPGFYPVLGLSRAH